MSRPKWANRTLPRPARRPGRRGRLVDVGRSVRERERRGKVSSGHAQRGEPVQEPAGLPDREAVDALTPTLDHIVIDRGAEVEQTRGPSKCCGSGCPWSPSSTTTTPATPPRRYGSWRKVGRVGDPLRRPPAQGLGRQPDLGRGAGAVGADVGVADVLAARAFGPGVPQSTPARHAGGAGLALVTRHANSPTARTLRWRQI